MVSDVEDSGSVFEDEVPSAQESQTQHLANSPMFSVNNFDEVVWEIVAVSLR